MKTINQKQYGQSNNKQLYEKRYFIKNSSKFTYNRRNAMISNNIMKIGKETGELKVITNHNHNCINPWPNNHKTQTYASMGHHDVEATRE